MSDERTSVQERAIHFGHCTVRLTLEHKSNKPSILLIQVDGDDAYKPELDKICKVALHDVSKKLDNAKKFDAPHSHQLVSYDIDRDHLNIAFNHIRGQIERGLNDLNDPLYGETIEIRNEIMLRPTFRLHPNYSDSDNDAYFIPCLQLASEAESQPQWDIADIVSKIVEKQLLSSFGDDTIINSFHSATPGIATTWVQTIPNDLECYKKAEELMHSLCMQLKEQSLAQLCEEYGVDMPHEERPKRHAAKIKAIGRGNKIIKAPLTEVGFPISTAEIIELLGGIMQPNPLTLRPQDCSQSASQWLAEVAYKTLEYHTGKVITKSDLETKATAALEHMVTKYGNGLPHKPDSPPLDAADTIEMIATTLGTSFAQNHSSHKRKSNPPSK